LFHLIYEDAIFRGGIKLTIQGQNMDVVLKPRMVVTIIIRRYVKGDRDARNGDDDREQIIRYPTAVCNIILLVGYPTLIFVFVCTCLLLPQQYIYLAKCPVY